MEAYLTEEKVINYIHYSCSFKPTSLCLNSFVQEGKISVKKVNGVLTYCVVDAVNVFKHKESRLHFKNIAKKSVCEKLGITEQEFEEDEDPMSEAELLEWAEKNLK